jgi:hypothetical protein
LLIWRVTVDLRVGHSIYELTFHPRNAGVVLFAVSGGAALINVKSPYLLRKVYS